MARILVLEDQPSQRFIMADLLVRAGHEVRCTEDPFTAIGGAEEFRPDLLVADWRLRHDLNGRDAAEALRRLNPGLHVVFITALPLELVETQAADLQPFKVVKKPCEFYDLLRTIHELLGDVVAEESSV